VPLWPFATKTPRREVGCQIIVTPALPTTEIAPLSLGDSYELMDNVQLRSEEVKK
jgi:hypothetical protein